MRMCNIPWRVPVGIPSCMSYMIRQNSNSTVKNAGREGSGRLKSGSDQGFFGHFSSVRPRRGCTPGAERERTRDIVFNRSHNPIRTGSRIDSAPPAGELPHGKTNAVHLTDREGDSYELFAFLLNSGRRFVIHLSRDRGREGGRAAPTMPALFETLSNAPYLFEREVVLSERNNRRIGKKKATFSDRRKRSARLEVRATHQEIFIGNGSSAHLPPLLRLNFAEVREPDSPEGEEPVVWRLVTTEPVDTEEDMAAIIDS